MMSNLAKIAFLFYSDIFEENMVESMWAEIIDEQQGVYKLDNIPFYATLVACGDVIKAEYDKNEERLIYKETIKASGNSVIQVVVLEPHFARIEEIRRMFKLQECTSERANDSYFVLEIPCEINYKPIQEQLYGLEEEEVLVFAEACLSVKHSQDLVILN